MVGAAGPPRQPAVCRRRQPAALAGDTRHAPRREPAVHCRCEPAVLGDAGLPRRLAGCALRAGAQDALCPPGAGLPCRCPVRASRGGHLSADGCLEPGRRAAVRQSAGRTPKDPRPLSIEAGPERAGLHVKSTRGPGESSVDPGRRQIADRGSRPRRLRARPRTSRDRAGPAASGPPRPRGSLERRRGGQCALHVRFGRSGAMHKARRGAADARQPTREPRRNERRNERRQPVGHSEGQPAARRQPAPVNMPRQPGG